ncbi:protein HflC [Desulfuromonas versatilis]|uniref:Protein HflC n=1 Tax=Desulfuromonas versatilis TaxID=2802975 RepID=A0ABN6E1I7_9BACT|nr:protease modulator HflC [Desulfuromonas versatilis]BCR06205.1 protein HflC [Desulfuromonas versatilis]
MKQSILMVVIVLVALTGFSGLFVVEEGEQALVTQFGKPVGDIKQAGIHFKTPLLQEVRRFQKRIMKWDGDPNQIPTKDKKYIWVDTTARWRIVDPLLFFKTVATERGAQSRLDDILDSVVRDAVSGHLLLELVRGKEYKAPAGTREVIDLEGIPVNSEDLIGREQILADILQQARASTPEYGIELIDVQIKRINYVEQVRQRVYERMISERKKVAAQYRSEGEGEKADILGQMQKELKAIESEAYRRSVEIRGAADAKAAGIYAAAYGRDADFYAFVRTLESYRKAVGDNGRLVLSTDAEFYRYLQRSR